MPLTKRKIVLRCGHYELAKTGGKWRCVSCGQILTIPESIQNSIELSDVMKSAFETGRPLNETLDDVLGRKEWDKILANISSRKKPEKRRR